MCRSPSSSRRCARSSAPDLHGVADAALALLLFATGAETPLLALLALRRPRNLAAVGLPYLVLVPLALTIGGFAPGLAIGALVLAIAPAELAAPALARTLGGRMETAAAVVTGTLVVSFALLLTSFETAASAAAANTALFGFVAGAAIAGAAPTLRDALLPVIRGASALALGILVIAAVVAGFPALRPEIAIAALTLLAGGSLAASVVAALLGGEPRAVVLGGGTRDFAVAATIAVRAGGDAAAALPLAYGALLFASVAAVAIARRMRQSPSEHARP